jgi:hypothetical protein
MSRGGGHRSTYRLPEGGVVAWLLGERRERRKLDTMIESEMETLTLI